MIWSREAGNPFHGSFFVWKFWTLWKQKNHIMETITKYVLAPLAGYTDLPFRRMCWKQGMDQAYTALIDAGALIFGNPENSHILARGDDEPWVGVQLMGSRLDLLEKAAPMLDAMDYDCVDFNMGCPVRKVVQRNAGAALLKTPEHALECVRLLRKLIHKPFSVKIRILDDHDPEPTVRFCEHLEACGVEAIAIHGRLACRVYSGPVAMDVIKAVREALHIPVTANGGIFGVRSAKALQEGTGCSRLMVARGAIGNPWIFKSLSDGVEYIPTHAEICDAIRDHLAGMVDLYGEQQAMVDGRKIVLAYMRGRGYHRALKNPICKMTNWHDFERILASISADRDADERLGISAEATLQDV